MVKLLQTFFARLENTCPRFLFLSNLGPLGSIFMHKLLSLTLTLTLGLALSTQVMGDSIEDSKDWPQWRGPHRDGVSTEQNLLKEWPEKGPELLWNSKVVNGGQSVGDGLSSISVADGKIYTMGDRDDEGFVFCLDEKTGKHIWATHITPANTVQHPGPRCIPTVDGNRVYVLSVHGTLVCLDSAKGNILWKKDFKKDFKGQMMSGWGYSESPLIDGEKLVCTPGGDEAALVALNKLTGEVIWKAPIKGSGGASYSSIVIANVGGIRQYIMLLGKEKGLVGVNAANGKFLWNYNRAAGGMAQIPTAVVKGDLVFTSTGYGGGAAILQMVPEGDGIKVKELHRMDAKTLQVHVGGMVLVKDKIYGGHGQNDGKLFCLDLMTGKLVWGPVRGAGSGDADLVYADGNLYVRYKDNVMALVEATPDGYKLKSKFQLPGNLGTGWPHPVVVHGRLYIRGPDQILCYDIKQK